MLYIVKNSPVWLGWLMIAIINSVNANILVTIYAVTFHQGVVGGAVKEEGGRGGVKN